MRVRALFSGVMLVLFGIMVCENRPEKTYEEASRPVVLYNQPENMVRAGDLELYQNTPPDYDALPFIFSVDLAAFGRYATAMRSEGVTVAGTTTRFVIHWPGSPRGSELECRDRQGIVLLELAREVCKYAPGPNLEEIVECMNRVFYHEAENIRHCREGTPRAQAEAEARRAERKRIQKFGRIIRIELKPNTDLVQIFSRVCAERR